MLRSVGIASRYVSGYFYASDPTNVGSADTDEIVVATHAWVELAVPGWGWWAIDPTNASPVGERHVKIGHGRDYDDVTPLRGVYYGESDHHLAAEVTMSTGQILRSSVPEVEISAEALAQQ
jgi:transglutaminase-like putative cysteine protease